MKLIIGLGNPGKEHEGTRHNVGFVLVDKIISSFQLPTPKLDKKSNAEICKDKINEKRVILAKPQTFMNNSGTAVRALIDFYKLTPKDLIVIHDDKDIPIGEIKIQNNRGAAGHNGVESIFEHLGTHDFTRIRVGVAPAEKIIHDTADFVLGKFSKEEQKDLKAVVEKVMQEIQVMIK